MRYAEFLKARGQQAEAAEQIAAASKLEPADTDLLFQGAVSDLQSGRAEAARKKLIVVLQRDPDHAQAQNHLAVLLAGQKRFPEAIELLRKAVALEPKNAEFYNNLGVILVRHGKHAEAMNALEEAVRLDSKYEEASKNLNDLKKLMEKRSKP